MVEQMDAKQTEEWLAERQKNLTEEERRAAEEQRKRHEKLESLGRIASVMGLVESPEVILEKMVSGLTELHRLTAIEGEMLDGALSVQAQRFTGLGDWYEKRSERFVNAAHGPLTDELKALGESTESLRMEILTSGKRDGILDIIEEAKKVAGKALAVWQEEDKSGGPVAVKKEKE